MCVGVCVCVMMVERVYCAHMSGPQPNTHPSPWQLGECERPMSTSMWFQQSHMVLTLPRTIATPARAAVCLQL